MKKKKVTKKQKFFNKLKTFVHKYSYCILMILSFFILDFALRYFTRSINFYGVFGISPNLFTISWIILFVGLSVSSNKVFSKIIYLSSIIFSTFLFLLQGVYYSMFKVFFDFSSLQYASEANGYLLGALKGTPIWVYLIIIVEIVLIVFTTKLIPNKKFNLKSIIVVIILFFVIHLIAPLTLGKAVTTWDAWRKPRNIYNSFNDNNRSMQISGLYEYNVRNFYVNYIRKDEVISSEEDKLLDEKFNKTIEHKNNYTGLFEGKNVLFIQLESIDKFLVTKNIMPTLYSLQNNSINFNDHYSFVSGGGSTFNSEFMVTTGYTNPISINRSAYTFSKNDYSYSLPNLLKNEGYIVNAFHMNSSEYYSRDVNYKKYGYDSFNSLKSMDNGKYYTDTSYWLDTELINNPIFNEKIFDTENKFANFIITYSAHMPFQTNKGVCSLLVDDETKENNEYTEFDCLKLQAKETDDMIKLILENLKEKDLIDNTILILYADHYLYTLADKTLLDNYKITDNNLINNTTFMIWSNKQKKVNINKTTSQLNILPTVANILGLDYRPNYYLMEDALDKNYEGLVFFSDYSWYDGNVYVDNGIVTNGKKISDKELERKNNLVNELIKTNDAVLTTDYFKNIKK